MRKAYINWERLTEESRPESGRTYLVALEEQKGVATQVFLTWYDKGAKVMLPCENKNEKDKDKNLSTEERLLASIFGHVKNVEIEEAGFYMITGDYGVDQEKYPGCTKEPVLFDADRIWYAEPPISPEDLLDINEQAEKERLEDEIERARAEEEFHQLIRDMSAEDGPIDQHVKGQYNWRRSAFSSYNMEDREGVVHENVISAAGGIYEQDGLKYPLAYMLAFQMIDTAMAFRGEISDSLLNEESARFKETHAPNSYEKSSEALRRTIRENDTYHILGTPVEIRYREMVIYALLNIRKRFDISRQECVNWVNRRHWSKTFSVAEKIMYANALRRLVWQLFRCTRLREIKAPDIILANEDRMLMEAIFILTNRPVALTTDFEHSQHFSPDGKWVDLPEDEEEDEEEQEEDNEKPETASGGEKGNAPNAQEG